MFVGLFCFLSFLFGPFFPFFLTETSSYSKTFVLKALNQAIIVRGRHELLAWSWSRHDRIIEDHEVEEKVAFFLLCVICKTECAA